MDQKRTVADLARQLGINSQTRGHWVRQERVDRAEREGITNTERAELAQLRPELC